MKSDGGCPLITIVLDYVIRFILGEPVEIIKWVFIAYMRVF